MRYVIANWRLPNRWVGQIVAAALLAYQLAAVAHGWTDDNPYNVAPAPYVEATSGVGAPKQSFGDYETYAKKRQRRYHQPVPCEPSGGKIGAPAKGGSGEIGGLLTKLNQLRQDLPISAGAWHWWHVNTGGPFKDGYGIPPTSGTYFYYLKADPTWDINRGSVSTAGAHVEMRLRDGGDPLRAFYPHSTFWFEKAFLWAATDYGVFRAGDNLEAVWHRLG